MGFDEVFDLVTHGGEFVRGRAEDALLQVLVEQREELVADAFDELGLARREKVGVPRHEIECLPGRVLDEDIGDAEDSIWWLAIRLGSSWIGTKAVS
jgi:hypothetical protein